jgi:hypothetical protein
MALYAILVGNRGIGKRGRGGQVVAGVVFALYDMVNIASMVE